MYANWSWEKQEIDCTETNLWCLRLPPWALVRALIGFHSFTGCYTVGRFSSKGKITCWKSLKKADKTTVQGFIDLGQTDIPSEVAISVRWKVIFVDCIYLGQATKITVLSGGCCSWKIKQSVKSSPPPPKLKLLYTSTYSVPITRPEYGIWLTLLIQYLPHGWTNEEGCLCPVRTLLKQAADAVIKLIKLQMSEI